MRCCCIKSYSPGPTHRKSNDRQKITTVVQIQPTQISMQSAHIQLKCSNDKSNAVTLDHFQDAKDEQDVAPKEKDDDLLSFYTAHSEWQDLEEKSDSISMPSPAVSPKPVKYFNGVGNCVSGTGLPPVVECAHKSYLEGGLKKVDEDDLKNVDERPLKSYNDEVLKKIDGRPRKPSNDEGLEEVRRCWFADIRPGYESWIDADPVLSPADTDKMLMRFLQAERNQKSPNPVASTIARLRETVQWRQDYRCVDFHRKGMARRLLMHKTNPGASIYFGDYGLRDCSGEPVLVGRVSLMTEIKARKPADKSIPCTHLRAAVFILDRAAVEAKEGGSYILDVGSYPKNEMQHRNRYWDADGFEDCSHVIKERKAPVPSVGPHLPEHETMPDGLQVLKEAMRMAQTYYPGLLKHIYFYRPSFMFRTIFAVFSMWVPPDTRNKFTMVKEGEEHKYFQAPGMCMAADLPPEFGGSGPPLDGDAFLSRAVDRYDRLATLPAQ